MMALCGIIIVLGVINIIFLGCIYETQVKQLSKISEFKNMYRREIQDLHSIHDYQDELIRNLYKKVTNEDIDEPKEDETDDPEFTFFNV